MYKTVGVVGLGKVGTCMASVFAKKHRVIGLDKDRKTVNSLQKEILHIEEKGINLDNPNLSFTASYKDIKKADIIFIIVPTPSLPNGSFSDRYIQQVLKKLRGYKGIKVISSTVSPGTCNQYQGRIVYNPFFIALGDVVRTLEKPDYVLLGGRTEDTQQVTEIYEELGNYKFKTMTLLEAEIVKLATNCCITTKITAANHIANICDELLVNIDIILDAIGSDSRIGNKFFRAGLGYGGPCFPRDNKAFGAFAGYKGDITELFLAVDAINNLQAQRWVDKVKKLNPSVVGFRSLSYKEGTNIQEESCLKKIYDKLKDEGFTCVIGEGDITFNHWGIE